LVHFTIDWVIKPEQTQLSASDTNEDTSKREGIENCIMNQESLKRLARYLIRAAHLPDALANF
jgi:hypothetical protein